MSERTSILKSVIELPMMLSEFVDRWARRATFKNGGGYMSQFGDNAFGNTNNGYRGALATYDSKQHRDNTNGLGKNNDAFGNNNQSNGRNNQNGMFGENNDNLMSGKELRSALQGKDGRSNDKSQSGYGTKGRYASAIDGANNGMSAKDIKDAQNQNAIVAGNSSKDEGIGTQSYQEHVAAMGEGMNVDKSQLASNASSASEYDANGNKILTDKEHLEKMPDGTFKEKSINGAMIDNQILNKQKPLELSDEEIERISDLSDVPDDLKSSEFTRRLLDETDNGFEIALRNLDLTPEDYKVLQKHGLVKNEGDEENENWVIDYDAMREIHNDPTHDLSKVDAPKEYEDYCNYEDTTRLLQKYGDDLSQLNAEDLEYQDNNTILKDAANGKLSAKEVYKEWEKYGEDSEAEKFRRADLVQAVAINGAESLFNNRSVKVDQKQRDAINAEGEKFYHDTFSQLKGDKKKELMEKRQKQVARFSPIVTVGKNAMHRATNNAKRMSAIAIRNALSGGHGDRTILGDRLTKKMDHYIENGSSKPSTTKKVAKKVGHVALEGGVKATNGVVRKVSSKDSFDVRNATNRAIEKVSREQRLDRKATRYANRQMSRREDLPGSQKEARQMVSERMKEEYIKNPSLQQRNLVRREIPRKPLSGNSVRQTLHRK